MSMKSCPFCGGKPQTFIRGAYGAYYIQCKQCSARSGSYMNKEAAQNAWNGRTRKPRNYVLEVKNDNQI